MKNRILLDKVQAHMKITEGCGSGHVDWGEDGADSLERILHILFSTTCST